jgi:hypothetical protein
MQVSIRSFLLALLLCINALAGSRVLAQEKPHPTAPKLFPDKTLVYFRVSDVKQLKQDFDRSSMGRLSKDAQLKPIIDEFYGSFVKSTEQMATAIGLNLDELLSIPSGEMAVAMFASGGKTSAEVEQQSNDEGQRQVSVRIKAPVFALMIDAGEEISSIQVLLQRMDQAIGEGSEHLQKNVDRLTLHSYQNRDRSDQQFAYFIDGGTMVACTNVAYIEDLAQVWLGKGDRKTLADNEKFVSIMSRSVGTEGERPQVTFYADPIGIVRDFTPKNPGTMLFLGMMGPLGIDGFEALGGSWIVSPPDFDSISHFHLSLASPRRAVLALLRPKSGSVTPEQWVPANVGSYMTVNWDIKSTIDAIERLFNQIRGQNAFEEQVLAVANQRLNLDIKKDVLDNMEGRLSLIQGFVRPISVNSGSNVYAVRLKNPKNFENNVLPKLVELVKQRTEVTTESFGKIRAQVIEVGNGRERPQAPVSVRVPEICFAIIDDYIVVSDSRYMMRQLADAMNDPSDQLRESLEFQLISDRIKAQVQDREPAGITFARPEESLQLFYELARDPKNRELLRQNAETNPLFKSLNGALEKHELPPFSVISKYLSPSGGYLVEEELGLHFTNFSLKRED